MPVQRVHCLAGANSIPQWTPDPGACPDSESGQHPADFWEGPGGCPLLPVFNHSSTTESGLGQTHQTCEKLKKCLSPIHPIYQMQASAKPLHSACASCCSACSRSPNTCAARAQVFVTSVPQEEDFAAWEKPTASSWFVRELAQQLQVDAA